MRGPRLLALLCCLCFGCGYGFLHAQLPAAPTRIYVQPFAEAHTPLLLKGTFTNQLSAALQQHGLQLSAEPKEAQWILSGTLRAAQQPLPAAGGRIAALAADLCADFELTSTAAPAPAPAPAPTPLRQHVRTANLYLPASLSRQPLLTDKNDQRSLLQASGQLAERIARLVHLNLAARVALPAADSTDLPVQPTP